MFSFIKNLFDREDFMFDDREEGRIKYVRLQRRGDLDYEVRFQRKKIELDGGRVLDIIENEEGILIVFRSICADDEAEDYTVLLRITVITLKGVKIPQPRLDAVYYKDEALIKIGDIKVFGKNKNHGYGSILVNELFKISDKQNVTKIAGWISEVDWSHVQRLKYFYEKHGFTVILNSEKKSGEIILDKIKIS